LSELIIEGLVYGLNGFGEALRNIVLGLNELGVKIQIVPKGSQKSRLPEHLVETLESLSKGGGNYETSPYLYFGLPCGPHKKSSVCNIAYVMFEAQSLTVDSVDKCNQMDWIWVPTTFCRDLFVSGGVNPKKIKVVPLGVDVDRFSPEASRIKFLPGSFKFLSVMDWSTRKGADLLIEAYLEEFNIEDNASLLIKIPANAKKRALNDIRVIKKKILKTNQPPIYLCCQTLPLADMPSLYNSVNAFVLPSRGEGWALPAVEAMATALPVITTGDGSIMDYANQKNAFLIENNGYAKCPSTEWIHQDYKNKEFACPDLEHLKKLMRFVYKNKDKAIEKGKRARETMTKKFTWNKSCRRMKRLLKDISDGKNSNKKTTS